METKLPSTAKVSFDNIVYNETDDKFYLLYNIPQRGKGSLNVNNIIKLMWVIDTSSPDRLIKFGYLEMIIVNGYNKIMFRMQSPKIHADLLEDNERLFFLSFLMYLYEFYFFFNEGKKDIPFVLWLKKNKIFDNWDSWIYPSK